MAAAGLPAAGPRGSGLQTQTAAAGLPAAGPRGSGLHTAHGRRGITRGRPARQRLARRTWPPRDYQVATRERLAERVSVPKIFRPDPLQSGAVALADFQGALAGGHQKSSLVIPICPTAPGTGVTSSGLSCRKYSTLTPSISTACKIDPAVDQPECEARGCAGLFALQDQARGGGETRLPTGHLRERTASRASSSFQTSRLGQSVLIGPVENLWG